MRPFLLLTSLCLAVITLDAVGQQRPAGHPPVPSKRRASSQATVPTPHEYARQLRVTVPTDASFRYYINYLDGTDDDIKDSLLVESDTKQIEYVRVSRATGQPLGMAKIVYWPSLRDAGEGKTQLIGGELKPIGPWVLWYDVTGKRKMMAVEVNAQGEPVLGTIQRWNEDGTQACLAWTEALPSTEKRLGSQTGINSWARVAVPVDLPENTASMIVCFDICDNGSPPAIWGAMASAGLTYVTGGMSAVVQAGIRSLTPSTPPAGAATNCFYFVTDDEGIATRFYNDQTVPPSEACLYMSPSAKREQRGYRFTRPTRRVWVCVENQNFRTAAVTSLSVKALTDVCGNAPR